MDAEHKKAFDETTSLLHQMGDRYGISIEKEERLDLLFKFSDMINNYHSIVELNKIKSNNSKAVSDAELFLHNLIAIYKRYGDFYVSEIIARRELYLKNVELFAANEKILELKSQIDTLTKTINFT
jgi:hypothetical protein